MICALCGMENTKLLHRGCRDNPKINVYRCQECGLVFLNTQSQITDKMYEEFGINRAGGGAEDFDYEAWLLRTRRDDMRRAGMVKNMSGHESVEICDFGCGNGGFLRELIKHDRERFSCFGVDLKKIAIERNQKDGIPCSNRISDFKNQKFDIITMFHVIEHLTQPVELLNELANYLKEDGLIILETPNADEALLKRYHCNAYADFTYWSEHAFLYTSDTLAEVAKRAGYQVVENTQLQRYSLTNHMYWLSKGKPGGHVALKEYVCPELEDFYDESLKRNGICDTLWLVIKR